MLFCAFLFFFFLPACNIRLCASLRQCQEDQYIAVPATQTSNRICLKLIQCSDSEYELIAPTRTSSRLCASCTTCPAGVAYQSRACRNDSDTVCSLCRTCPEDTFEASPCNMTNRVCTPVSLCGTDEVEMAAPTPTTDRQCQNVTQCLPFIEYEGTPPTPTTDRVCALTSCDDGTYEIVPPTISSAR